METGRDRDRERRGGEKTEGKEGEKKIEVSTLI